MSKMEYFMLLAIKQYENGRTRDYKTYYKCWVNDMAEVLRENSVDRFKLLELLLKQY